MCDLMRCVMSVVNSQSHSTALTVISANIEGLTASKTSILSDMCKRERFFQGAHKPTILSSPNIAGLSQVDKRPYTKYGSAILIKDDLKVESVYERVQGSLSSQRSATVTLSHIII